MERITSGLVSFYKWAVSIIFFIIIAALTIASLISTAYVTPDLDESTYYQWDNPLVHLAVLALLTTITLMLLRRKKVQEAITRINTDAACYKKWRNILLFILAAMGIIWVLCTQFIPDVDQWRVQIAVEEINNGDIQSFVPSGYMSDYPQQFGLFWVCLTASKIFGSCNYTVFQLFSTASTVLFAYELTRLSEHFKAKNIIKLLMVAVCIAFLPLTLYQAFVYGNLMGLALSTAALRHECDYFKSGNKGHILASLLLITLAMIIKSNYLIVMVGMAGYAVVEALRQKKLRIMIIVVLMLVCYLVQSKGILKATQALTGQELNRGVSNWAYVAMGLHNGENPGWFDAYVFFSMEKYNYTPELQTEDAKADIKASIKNYIEHPGELLSFIVKKNASEWNNPTFQGFWVIQFRDSAITPPGWVEWLLHGSGYEILTYLLNLLQTLILIGTCYYMIACRRMDSFVTSLTPALIFIGGFVFHCFWEAKAQYTFSYFVLIIPYACIGYYHMLHMIRAKYIQAKKGEEK